MAPKATLIQDINEYVKLLEPLMWKLMHKDKISPDRLKEGILWIIREELDQIYHFFDMEHDRNNPVWKKIHAELNCYLSADLSFITSYYIKIFPIFDESRSITTKLSNGDLTIQFQGYRLPYNILDFHHVNRARC